MATLVLTTVGTLVGGPIGGVIGSLIGSQVDARLLGPKGRQGPRLGQLSVQTSSYGTQIPKLFGTLRVAGTVIWATDLAEAQHRPGGGKGAPSSTNYSYSASFAVALSGRPIRGVGRIWADGKLLRGAAGDWKSQTGFRLYPGGEDQAVDPLIASAEGIGETPAYRGLAYAVFEDFQLADYGNRIPSLTFEVEADAAPVAAADIARALSDGAAMGEAGATLDGFAVAGDSVRGVLEAMAAALPLTLADEDGVLVLRESAGEPIAIPEAAGGAQRTRIERRAAGTLPDEIALSYYEPERDYQAGLQRARRGGPGRRVEPVELAGAIAASRAKALAEGRLARDWAERTSATVTLPWSALTLSPGMAVTLAGRGETWRIAEAALETMAVRLELVATAPASGLAPPASAGRGAGEADLAHGPTRVMLIDMPAAEGAPADQPRLWIAATGPSPGWRRAMLETSLDGGASWQPLGPTAQPAVMGILASGLASGSPVLRDDRAEAVIELLHDGMALASLDGVAASATANLALIGDELVQFERAERIASATWRLTRLLRGRRGTEWAMVLHAVGERFILIEAEALRPWDVPASAIGAVATISAQGVGDAVPAIATAGVAARSLAPPSPVHAVGERGGDGALAIGWTRRSRLGWSWTDGDEVPLGEAAERYRVTLSAGAASRTIETAAPVLVRSAVDQAADGFAPPDLVSVAVRQVGGRGVLSAPLEFTV